MIVYNIKWDIDDICDYNIYDYHLPVVVFVPDDIEVDYIADYLSDEYGFCVESFEIDKL